MNIDHNSSATSNVRPLPSQKTQYRNIHLFIDETGDIANTLRSDFRALGGVLVMGDYGPAEAHALLAALQQSVVAAGGKFPQDLHGSSLNPRTNQSAFNQHRFFVLLEQGLRQWCGSHHEIFGAHIEHKADIWDNGLMSEKFRDNRYLLMFRALIEQMLFIAPELKSKIASNARISLTVARRACHLQNTLEHRQNLEYYGVPFSFDEENGDIVIHESLDQRDLVTILQSSLLEFGGAGSVEVDQITVEPIDYQTGLSSPGLYLADLHLYQVRRSRFGRPYPCVVSRKWQMRYGSDLRHLRNAALAYRRNDFWGTLRFAAPISDESDYT